MTQILIVDDNEHFLEALKDLLEAAKFNVLLARNGKQAQALLEAHRVDAVLSDIQMPVMRGDELLSWSCAYRPVPFILMTGYSNVMDPQDAYTLGAGGFLTKPFRIVDLMQTIHSVLQNSATA